MHEGAVAHEFLLVGFDFFLLQVADFDFDDEASHELAADVLGAAEALELAALDHDAHLGGHGLGLFHRVGSEHDGGGFLGANSADLSLEVATAVGVNTSGGFVEQNDVGVAHDGNTEADLALVATAQVADLLVAVSLEAEVADDVLNKGLAFAALNTSNGSEVPEGLLNRHLTDEFGVLWAVADHALHDVEVL